MASTRASRRSSDDVRTACERDVIPHLRRLRDSGVAIANKRTRCCWLYGAPSKLIFSIAKAQGGRKRCVFVVKVTASIYLLVGQQSENCQRGVSPFSSRESFPNAVDPDRIVSRGLGWLLK
jgi:hypothetical protein